MIFTAEDILNRLRVQPFRPLRFVTTNNRTYDIRHPELVIVGRRFIEVGIPDRKNPIVADMIDRIPLVHLTGMDDLPMPVAPDGVATAEEEK